jgi:hypothetical protein
MNFIQRSSQLLSLENYGKADGMILQCPLEVTPPAEQMILRMMVRDPRFPGWKIPPDLAWLEQTIYEQAAIQSFLGIRLRFVYVTVRCGLVTSTTDDEWHVDGFSMRVPHLPEQNHIWSDCYPTEILDQQFSIPESFNPKLHNLHHYFQDHADPACILLLKPRNIAIIDPYVVHRRPQVPTGVRRCFFRISFVPIEIEDDTCTRNPLLPKRPYNRTDIRTKLTRWKVE